jgi:hypothetical protein
MRFSLLFSLALMVGVESYGLMGSEARQRTVRLRVVQDADSACWTTTWRHGVAAGPRSGYAVELRRGVTAFASGQVPESATSDRRCTARPAPGDAWTVTSRVRAVGPDTASAWVTSSNSITIRTPVPPPPAPVPPSPPVGVGVDTVPGVVTPPDTTPTPPPADTTSPPPTTGVAFFSDWRSGTPSDGGKWIETDSPNSISVVTTQSVGGTWPAGMTHALRVAYNSGGFASVSKENGWPLPTIGEYLYRRIGLRVNVTSFGGEARDHHPMQSMGVAASTCAYAAEFVLFHSASSYQLQVANLNNGSSQPMYRWQLRTALSVGEFWQIEERYLRTGTSTYNVALRAYDAAGTLRYQSADFPDTWNNQGTPGTQPVHIQASGTGGACLRHLNIGNQGRNYGATQVIYWGAVAVKLSTSANDWIGAY